MTVLTQHQSYGEIIYKESFWTGKKSLTINGVDAQPVSKKEFVLEEKRIIIKGNYLTGIVLHLDGDTVRISEQTKWYEFILSIIPFIFLLTWGNNATLCSIFPVVGGALGGAIGGIGLITSLFLMKKTKAPIVKVLIGLGVAVATVLIAFLIAIILLGLFAQ